MERTNLIQQLERLEQPAQTSIATKHDFACAFRPMHLNKDQQLSSQDASDRSLYFLQEGLLHLHKQNKNHQKNKNENKRSSEILSLQFYSSGQFFSLSHHPQDSGPANIRLSALRPSQILAASYQRLKATLQKDPQLFDIIGALHQHWQEQEHRRIELLTTSPATSRYQLLSETLGKDLYHIPRQLLARYLGISRKHLARIHYQQLLQQKT